MEQRAAKASRFVGIRLTPADQTNLRAIIAAGLADNISDAIRCGLECAAAKARRLLGK
ncbi:MAG TPA: hypothetical protein VGR43_02415 [Dehalococcoidia bacterium]|nr:hypothetical protein [Dehalococcoidia bacterium]